MKRYTIMDFNRDFPDDDACLDHVLALVYPEHQIAGEIRCRTCEEVTKHHKLKGRKAYSCQKCGTHVYPLAGTIFEKSRTPLKSWFYAMYLISTTRMGISAKQLERELGVTYKTAWRMFKQIRVLMGDDSPPLSGTVEVDETYYGGKPRHRQGAGDDRPRNKFGRIKLGPRPRTAPDAKKPIVGMVERDGNVKAVVTKDTKNATIFPLMEDRIEPGTTVYTDDAPRYRSVGQRGWKHASVNHSTRIYVDGPVHTNTIEGFWSLLKNGIRGTYRSVGQDYLQQYVNEYAFRYSHRNDETPMFETIAGRVRSVRGGKLGVYAPLPD